MRSKFHALAICIFGSIAISYCKPAQLPMEENAAVPAGTLYRKSLQAAMWTIVEQIAEASLHTQSKYFLNINQHVEKETFIFLGFPDGFSKIWHGGHLIESSIVLTYNSPNSANNNNVVGKIKFRS
jgi:hypothetical protein